VAAASVVAVAALEGPLAVLAAVAALSALVGALEAAVVVVVVLVRRAEAVQVVAVAVAVALLGVAWWELWALLHVLLQAPAVQGLAIAHLRTSRTCLETRSNRPS